MTHIDCILPESSRRRTLPRQQIFFILFVFCLLVSFSFLYTKYLSRTSAADLSQFQPGNIISDYVMSNADTMTESEIQAFLKSKNHCNNQDTYMANWYQAVSYHIEDGHFVCMADEKFDVDTGKIATEGSKNVESAAHIIWQAAQDYQINPQVIIVLLQKEQGLVTDTWPNDIQYRSATGYGCPDTAACDTKYYGLRNQVRNAAEMFRSVLDGGWTNYPLGNNYIRYNPNANCGGTTVKIENLATSALYRYTPYQPNASALAAGYGTGNSCSAYGNRNFYAYFTDWFGDTTAGEHRSDAPRNIKATSDGDSITVTWEAPTDLGIPRLQYYEIVVANTEKKEWKAQVDAEAGKYIFKGMPDGTYFAASVSAVNSVGASFARITFSIELNNETTQCAERNCGFLDMPTDETSAKAVSWAVNNGITDKNTYFNGESPASRRQIIVMLWRIAGQPESPNYNGFLDMPTDETSAKAVSWAVNNGITDKNTYFNGESQTSRRQAVVLMHRLKAMDID